MKIVTPFRPFAPESLHHQRLGPFDWNAAIRMLRTSARRAIGCDTFVITDVDAADGVPGPVHAFHTNHRRLMLWILDVSLAYLRSSSFDVDTVLVSPDVLVLGDLRPFFRADLGLVVRTSDKFAKVPEKQVLNSVQWWRVAAKDQLIAFYARALAMAITLPDNRITWGADTDPLITLIAPVTAGLTQRGDLSVYGHEMATVMLPLSTVNQNRIDRGANPMPTRTALIDFKYGRKRYQQRYFDAVFGIGVPA